FFFLLFCLLPRSTLFPYTTLFRSRPIKSVAGARLVVLSRNRSIRIVVRVGRVGFRRGANGALDAFQSVQWVGLTRVARKDAIGVDRKSTRLNSSHVSISYAVFCLK